MQRQLFLIVLLVFALSTAGCGAIKGKKEILDPSKPVTVTVWHYYNGHIKEKFDSLVAKFNESVGVEKGIIIDAQSLGDVQQLADAVFDAANKKIGSQQLPDIFMAYPENAFRVHQVSPLVSLDELFTDEELKRYRAEFLEEGRFGSAQKLYIVPFAKSTENLYLNKTFWDDFAKTSGADIGQLKTWEGLVDVAKLYYQQTGKAFLGIDANANYMLLAAMQLGNEMYKYEGERARFNFTETVAKKIWQYYYTPYIKGYFEKNGRFSSDDARTGNVLAYTGSTAGAAYFPAEVTMQQDKVYQIEPMTLPYPYFGNGKPFAIQQGAGMCVTRSDQKHEFAAGVFLKWFTSPEQNLEFAVSTGYFPVMKEVLNKESLQQQINNSKVANKSIVSMVNSTISMFDTYTLYNSKPFKGSYELRALLEGHLFSKIQKDLGLLERRIKEGEKREEVINDLTSEAQFAQWYQQILKEVSLILGE